MYQHEFLLECLKLCKKMQIHTCIDTSGVGENYEEILKYTDLVIWDVQALDPREIEQAAEGFGVAGADSQAID